MKILVANNCVPFVRGGAEHLAAALTEKLNEFGHEAMLVRIPFRWEPPDRILEGILACRLMRLPNVDRVIAFKFPAYFLPHDNKILWIVHQFRQVYDLWGTPYQGMEATPANLAIRRSIVESDNAYLPEARTIYTNSSVTSDRLKRFNNLDSEVLHPPLLATEHLRQGPFGDYIFCAGRVTASKRQHLLVEAMQYVKTGVKLIIAGSTEAADDEKRILDLLRKPEIAARVQFFNRFITEEEKAAWFASSLAASYIPYDEDSYGYVTLEAFYSGKPVLTTTDSGGILSVVRHNETGLVVEPDARALAAAMDDLFQDPQRAQRMGAAGLDLAGGMKLTWEHVVQTLTRT
jgi:glycosyltransferase involved in cell wall biosynthesis